MPRPSPARAPATVALAQLSSPEHAAGIAGVSRKRATAWVNKAKDSGTLDVDIVEYAAQLRRQALDRVSEVILESVAAYHDEVRLLDPKRKGTPSGVYRLALAIKILADAARVLSPGGTTSTRYGLQLTGDLSTKLPTLAQLLSEQGSGSPTSRDGPDNRDLVVDDD